MTLYSKTVQIKIKSDGDVFYKLWKANPHQVPILTPKTVPNCQILEGEVGQVGCVLLWNYFDDGNERYSKTIITEIDEGKKGITFKLLGGDLFDLYKTFFVHVHVDTNGLDNIVTWSVEYEKFNANDPDPDTLMEFYEKATKDIEARYLDN